LLHAACIRAIPTETGIAAAGDAISAATQQSQSAATVIASTFDFAAFDAARGKSGTVTDCAETCIRDCFSTKLQPLLL